MRFYLFIIPVLFLGSCISQSTLFHGIDDSQINAEHISGYYSNDPDEDAAPLAWQLSKMQRKVREDEVYPEVTKVLLDYDGMESLQVSLYTDSSLVDYFYLKVKNLGNHLEIKRRIRLVPIPILLWLHDEKRCLLMNDSEGKLIVSNARFQAIFFLTMARSNSRHAVADYDSIHN